ncbi:hypothetical protein LF1_21140 [Rubripirellula obstinata]|uniref:Uncharacterized protein n=1 Tax=Rubripirellula obstinata TaxID=406547 RepID=A0A5B1CIZ3_9BACT|nr:hypothetical protein [Rubripirellula obstinata]KAA1259580.1 hypothetical protein LF1_21140 [Rubripirellula obstinata]
MTNYSFTHLFRRLRHQAFSAWLLGGLLGGCFTLALSPQWAFAAETVDAQNTSNACVLLKNDNVIFGTAYQVGEYVVIRRGDQSELRLPRTAVACWAGSTADLYRYRVDHRLATGYDIHIQEAEWCLQNDLIDLAKSELQQAKEMMPSSPAVARLEERIRRITSPNRVSVPTVDNVMPVVHEQEPVATNVVHPQAISEFARSVQVTLLNRCGNCHATDTDRAWTIASPPGKTRASAEMTSQNMLATLPFIDSAQPLNSVLLTKALTAHGGAAASLGPRHAKAVYSLRRWLLLVGQSDQTQAAIELPAPTEFVSEDTAGPRWAASESEIAEPLPQDRDDRSSTPSRMPEVEDPFDPDLFNRQFHR